MALSSTLELNGLTDIKRRVAQLGLQAKDLRRPNVNIGKEMVNRNRSRLAAGVDVHGMPMQSKAAARLGLVPLGGGHRTPGKSVKYEVVDDGDLDLFSTWVGARLAYKGGVVVPRLKKWLTIPMEARGGSESRGRAGLSMEGNRTGRRALHYKDTFFLRVNGKLFLVQKDARVKGKNAGKLRFLFFLTKSVRYPKNEWLGYSNKDLEMVVSVYGQHLDTFDDKGGRT